MSDDSINSFTITNSKNVAFQVDFSSFSPQCTWRTKEEIQCPIYSYYTTCASSPCSLVPFFLEETPKALYFPYIAYCSLHSKFWKAGRDFQYTSVILKGLYFSALKLKQNNLIWHCSHFFHQYLLLNERKLQFWIMT